MPGITHSVAATGVDSGDGKVSVNAWNAEHVVPDGALTQAAVAGLVAALAAKQAAAALLTALAALDGTAGILRVTGAGTVERLTDTVAGRALLTAADAAAQRLALGLGTAATTAAADYATAAHNHAGVYSPVGHGHAAGDITGLGTAALVDTGTGPANVPTITQADGRYALAGTTMTIGLAVALAAGVVAY